MRADGDSRNAHLKRVKEIDQVLSGKWPAEPVALYRLACYLTNEEAILTAPSVAESTSIAQTGNTTTTE